MSDNTNAEILNHPPSEPQVSSERRFGEIYRTKAIDNFSLLIRDGKEYSSKDEYLKLCGTAAQNTDFEQCDILQAFLFQFFGREAAKNLYGSNIQTTSYAINYENINPGDLSSIDFQQVSKIINMLPDSISGTGSEDILRRIISIIIEDKCKYARSRRIDNFDRSSIAAGRCYVLSAIIIDCLNQEMPDLDTFEIKIEAPCVTDSHPPFVAIMDQHNLFGIQFSRDGVEYVLLVDSTVAQMDEANHDIEFSVIPKSDYKDYVQLRYGGFPFEGESVLEYRKVKVDQSVYDSITIDP